MGCDPPQGGGDERFYVYFSAGLTIYGHTIDEWGLERYPEDAEMIARGRMGGREFGCWHSEAAPDGEFGTNPMEGLHEIAYAAFMQAREHGWPDLK